MNPSDRRMAADRRTKIADSLLEVLTSGGISTEEIWHFIQVNEWFGSREAVDAFLQRFETEDLRQEVACGIITHCLNRLK
jgi:hypothetical protein